MIYSMWSCGTAASGVSIIVLLVIKHMICVQISAKALRDYI